MNFANELKKLASMKECQQTNNINADVDMVNNHIEKILVSCYHEDNNGEKMYVYRFPADIKRMRISPYNGRREKEIALKVSGELRKMGLNVNMKNEPVKYEDTLDSLEWERYDAQMQTANKDVYEELQLQLDRIVGYTYLLKITW